MSDLSATSLLATFLIFCRFGSCMMVLPGYSSQQLPTKVRLLMAIACTLALAPMLVGDIRGIVAKSSPPQQIMLIVAEVCVGLMIGLFGRVFFLALEFVGAAISTFLGYGATPGVPIEDTEPASSIGSLITLSATIMIFLTDMHIEALKALLQSYNVVAVSPEFGTEGALRQLTTVAAKAFMVALQIGAPFIVYSIAVNMMFGLASKLMPQLPIYFVSIPFVIAGGLAILILVIGDFLDLFMQAYIRWLVTGAP